MDVTGHELAERYTNDWEASRPHPFIARSYGTPEACRVCGGTEADVIHDGPWRPARREAGNGGEVTYG